MKSLLENEKEKLKLEKSRLAAREKRLRDKERKMRISRLIELGELVEMAGVEKLNHHALLGALLEMNERAKEEEMVKMWKDKGEREKGTALVLRFGDKPEGAIKLKLKNLGFHWNRFRKEWHGYGKKEEIEKVFVGVEIEEVE